MKTREIWLNELTLDFSIRNSSSNILATNFLNVLTFCSILQQHQHRSYQHDQRHEESQQYNRHRTLGINATNNTTRAYHYHDKHMMIHQSQSE